MFLILLMINYYKDCKLKGKENLAVPLKYRLLIYFANTLQFCIILILEFMYINK